MNYEFVVENLIKILTNIQKYTDVVKIENLLKEIEKLKIKSKVNW